MWASVAIPGDDSVGNLVDAYASSDVRQARYYPAQTQENVLTTNL